MTEVVSHGPRDCTIENAGRHAARRKVADDADTAYNRERLASIERRRPFSADAKLSICTRVVRRGCRDVVDGDGVKVPTQLDDHNGEVACARPGLRLDEERSGERADAATGDDVRNADCALGDLAAGSPRRAPGDCKPGGAPSLEDEAPFDPGRSAARGVPCCLVPGALPSAGDVVVAAPAHEAGRACQRDGERGRKAPRSGIRRNAHLDAVSDGRRRRRCGHANDR